MRKIRVGILFGGRSAEHEVSLQSARNIIDAIDRKKFTPVPIGITKKGQWIFFNDTEYLENEDNPVKIQLKKRNSSERIKVTPQTIDSIQRQGVDVVFPILHGPYGEDGTVQGLLKLSNVPFVGASVLGSAVGMDKDVMKRLLKAEGIPVASFTTVHDFEIKKIDPGKIVKSLDLPLFVKPASLGSSVGVEKVEKQKDLLPAVKRALKYDRKVLVEEMIKGREIECAVLGNDEPIASIAGEIVPNDSFYSYRAKYIDENGARLEVPADISAKVLKKAQGLSIKTFKVLCCEGMARVDFFLKKNGELVVNEINTIPGFTEISMYPKLWEASGVSYSELLDRLITLALERFEKEKKLKLNIEF